MKKKKNGSVSIALKVITSSSLVLAGLFGCSGSASRSVASIHDLAEVYPDRLDYSLQDRAAKADTVVVGQVAESKESFGSNEHGDQLIYTTQTVAVSEMIKGASSSASKVEVKIEGGCVGEGEQKKCLQASDLKPLPKGQNVMLFLRPSQEAGKFLPQGRSGGVLLLNAKGDLASGNLARKALMSVVKSGVSK
ncbi:MAG: hypothetical protein H7301_00990 [Cryobacterium sp.]|nr:hypothetical protein [Oligoflexia bacterium]